MSLVLNTNYDALNSQNALTSSGMELSTALAQLSSGLRVNTAADDAAGYAISQSMTAQINGLNQAARNANDGVSLTQTAQGALTQITNDLQSMRTLAVQSLNATNSAQNRQNLDQQFQQLSQDIDQVSRTANFNGVNLLDGTFAGAQFQIGANVNQTITVSSVASARTGALGQYQGYNLANQSIGVASNTATASTVTVGGGPAVSLGSIATDAKAIASAINSSSVAGLSATANTTSVAAAAQTITTTTAGTVTITVNGLAITVNATTNAGTNRANAVAALNAQSSVTGVVAQDTGSGVSLAAADGRNITTAFALGTAAGTTLADFGMAAAGTTGASININYSAPAGVTGNVVFAGAFVNTTAIAATGTAISGANVQTLTNSNNAITSIDAAIQQVSAIGSQLGAFQNRFQSVISGLNTSATNLSSARSRITDADYASATANLAKAQILQQASTAMVAKANTIPQNILTLIQRLP
jgi:flagellin